MFWLGIIVAVAAEFGAAWLYRQHWPLASDAGLVTHGEI